MRAWMSVIGLGLGLAQAAVARAQDPVEEASRSFDRAYEAFARAYRDGDPAAVAGLYAEDAFYLAPGDPIARGDVIRHFAWLSSYDAGRGPVVEFVIVDRTVAGDLAYDIGTYAIRAADAPEDGGSRGKFIVIWKRDADGVWKIHADGFSGVSDAPEEAE